MQPPTLGLGRAGGLVILAVAAGLEVAGDALIRKGLRGSGALAVIAGVAVLGAYGVMVNLLELDFSRLLGAYVGVFAIASVAAGRLFFKDQVPASTWIGVLVILGGSLIIHFGRSGG
jgi:drug/metabolite transporter superfamily protein YnfA